MNQKCPNCSKPAFSLPQKFSANALRPLICHHCENASAPSWLSVIVGLLIIVSFGAYLELFWSINSDALNLVFTLAFVGALGATSVLTPLASISPRAVFIHRAAGAIVLLGVLVWLALSR